MSHTIDSSIIRQESKTVLEYLIKICLDNNLPRSISGCKAMLYSAYQVSETILTEEDWGIVYQRDVLINGRLIRFYPTTYNANYIPTGWGWTWSTVTFVTNDDDIASNPLEEQLVEELKIRAGYYKLWRK